MEDRNATSQIAFVPPFASVLADLCAEVPFVRGFLSRVRQSGLRASPFWWQPSVIIILMNKTERFPDTKMGYCIKWRAVTSWGLKPHSHEGEFDATRQRSTHTKSTFCASVPLRGPILRPDDRHDNRPRHAQGGQELQPARQVRRNRRHEHPLADQPAEGAGIPRQAPLLAEEEHCPGAREAARRLPSTTGLVPLWGRLVDRDLAVDELYHREVAQPSPPSSRPTRRRRASMRPPGACVTSPRGGDPARRQPAT